MSYLKNYLTFNVGNECPKIYIMWSALTTLSVAIGRRAYLDQGQFRYHCNLYTCVIGPAGNRKTAARDIALEILHEAIPDVTVSSSCETRQGITKYLASDESTRRFIDQKGEQVEYKPYAIFANELSNYISLDPIGMIDFITDIYDRKFYDYKLKNEAHLIKNPYFVMFTCAVTEWITKQISSSSFCAGFGRRAILICDDSDVRIAHPFVTEEGKRAYAACVEWLKKIQNVSGFFKLTDAADKIYINWYENLQHPPDVFMKAWSRSKHVQLLKVAMLTSLSEGTDLTITDDHLNFAFGLLNEVEERLPMLTSRMGRGELVEPAANIIAFIKSRGGLISEKELRKEKMFKDFRSPMEYLQVMDQLKTTEQLIIFDGEFDGVQRKYVATPEKYKTLKKKDQHNE